MDRGAKPAVLLYGTNRACVGTTGRAVLSARPLDRTPLATISAPRAAASVQMTARCARTRRFVRHRSSRRGARPPLTLPQPSPAASITQQIGLTDNRVSRRRPRKVSGYDQVCRDENTTITFSSDVTVGGQKIAAGVQGLHMIPTAKDWTIILNRESHAWGSFFYDQKDDAARFTVTPHASDHVERLAYTLIIPPIMRPATLHWEKLAVPLAVRSTRRRSWRRACARRWSGLQGFFWQPFAQAAAYWPITASISKRRRRGPIAPSS